MSYFMHVFGTRLSFVPAEKKTRHGDESSAAAAASESRTPLSASATLTGTVAPTFHFDFGAGEKKPRIVYVGSTVTSADAVSLAMPPMASVPLAVTTLWIEAPSAATTLCVHVYFHVSDTSSLALLFTSPTGPDSVPASHFGS